MCHLVLFMPLFALPIFWLAPLDIALPLYIFVLLVSVLLYWFIAKSMVKQPQTGAESLIGVKAEVVSKLGPTDQADYLVRTGGELWGAYSSKALQPGETVKVVSLDGIRLVVERRQSLNE